MVKCEFPNCSYYSGNSTLCIRHAKGMPKENKPKYRIPVRSKKKIAQQKVYALFVAEYLSRETNQYCAIRWENCTGKATAINHLKRRFKDTIMDEDCIEPCCYNCNLDCEIQDARARKEGHLKSKF